MHYLCTLHSCVGAHWNTIYLALASGVWTLFLLDGPVTRLKAYEWTEQARAPLHYASKSGHIGIVQALLAAGADVHAIGVCRYM